MISSNTGYWIVSTNKSCAEKWKLQREMCWVVFGGEVVLLLVVKVMVFVLVSLFVVFYRLFFVYSFSTSLLCSSILASIIFNTPSLPPFISLIIFYCPLFPLLLSSPPPCASIILFLLSFSLLFQYIVFFVTLYASFFPPHCLYFYSLS